ncbi:hypothetical protein C2S51_031277 [Perilla frutescens var. frutescens]|nr:hypothetical protein C2S51_031277 [Perilla frutescens var. frutescens]
MQFQSPNTSLNNELLWEEADEPLHDRISLSNCSQTQSDWGNGVGPGMPFSNSVLKRDPTFGVIGTAIDRGVETR